MPITGNQKLAILRCKFSDVDNEFEDDAWFRDLFFSQGTDSLNDYYRHVSFGTINFDNSTLFPWRSLGIKRDDFVSTYADRGTRIQQACDRLKLDRTKYGAVIVIVNADINDSGNGGGNGIIVQASSDQDLQSTFIAHELGHVFGLNDSFDESDRLWGDDHTYGWYWDQYDIMSARHVFSHSHSRFRVSGPLMCTANADWNGWIPAKRVFTIGAGTNDVFEMDLVSLGVQDARDGYVCLRVGEWYIEHRTPIGWDAGLTRSCVLIHSITATANATVHASNVKSYNNEWQTGQTFGPDDLAMQLTGGTQVTIVSFNDVMQTARLRIRTSTARTVRVPEMGPGRVFGGVAVDGGGFIILPNGQVIRIPPWNPVMNILQHIGLVAQAENILTVETRATVAGDIYKRVATLAQQAAKRVGEEAQRAAARKAEAEPVKNDMPRQC